MRTKDSRAVLRGLGHSNAPRLPGELDQSLEMAFVLKAVERALAGAVPEIVNSDQGSHFTSPRYTQLLKEHAIKISMDGKGRALDKLPVSHIFGRLETLKLLAGGMTTFASNHIRASGLTGCSVISICYFPLHKTRLLD